jgi:MFS family permease
MIAGKFIFGSLGDKVDHRKLYWLMSVSLGLSLFLYQGAPGRIELTLAAALQGLATGGMLPMMGIMYASRFGTLSFGKVLGFVNLFLMIGSFGSLFSGWMFDTMQSYDFAFWTFFVLLVPAAIAMRWLPAPANQTESH